MLGMKPIAAHQTIEIDVKRLRDEQTPDVSGRVIPLDLASGQIMWSLKQIAPPPAGEETRQGLALIGRSEQVDVQHGISSNYACQSCCSNGYSDSYIIPASSDVEVDTLVNFAVAYQIDKDCYNDLTLPYPRTLESWSSTDTETATINNSGVATAIGAGETTIQVSWIDYRYDLQFAPCSDFSPGAPQCWDCNSPTQVFASPSAVLRVRPRITSITPSRGVVGNTTNVTIAGKGFRSTLSVNPIDGITVSGITLNSSTSISASFAVAADATGGNRAVTIKSRGRDSKQPLTFSCRYHSRLLQSQ